LTLIPKNSNIRRICHENRNRSRFGEPNPLRSHACAADDPARRAYRRAMAWCASPSRPKGKQPIPAADNPNTRCYPVEYMTAEVKRMFKTRSSKPKGLLSFYGLLCVSLAFMVFAWGTSYKLSLYRAEHQSSPAKVCTLGSDAAKNALDHAADGHTLSQTPLSVAVLFSLRQGTEDYSLDRLSDEAIIELSPLSRAPILYLRPPPDEGRSLD
jgi:hypothetical protein